MNEVLMTRRRKIIRFTCHRVPARPGTAGKLFTALGKKNINILHMFNTEHGPEEGDISFSVSEECFEEANRVLESIRADIGIEEVTVQHDLAILSFDLEETVCETVIGTMTLALSALAREHIDVKHIAASRNRVFAVINDEEAERASYILSRVLKEDPIIHPI
jgi:aspartate kinase